MWQGVMRQFYLHPVLVREDGLFRMQFVGALEANNPQAHYLEGLRYARWEKDLESAKKHVFKAINLVPEANFVMVMLAICGGEKEIGEFFTEQLHRIPWGEVLEMGDSVLSSLARMGHSGGSSYAQTWDGPVPDCSEFHSIHDRCEECFIYFCSKEFCNRC